MDAERRRELTEAYRRLAPAYDSGLARAQRFRLWPRTHERAVDRLDLRPGDVVLDVGCGTGLSFPFIEERLGPSGRIVGIDLSPDMLALARERADAAGWENVTLIESAVEEAEIPAVADAALFHFAGEIMRSRAALANVFANLKAGGRVAAAGARREPWWLAPVNAYVWFFARRFLDPRECLGPFVPDLRVERVGLGGVYVAWGTAATPGQAEA